MPPAKAIRNVRRDVSGRRLRRKKKSENIVDKKKKKKKEVFKVIASITAFVASKQNVPFRRKEKIDLMTVLAVQFDAAILAAHMLSNCRKRYRAERSTIWMKHG